MRHTRAPELIFCWQCHTTWGLFFFKMYLSSTSFCPFDCCIYSIAVISLLKLRHSFRTRNGIRMCYCRCSRRLWTLVKLPDNVASCWAMNTNVNGGLITVQNNETWMYLDWCFNIININRYVYLLHSCKWMWAEICHTVPETDDFSANFVVFNTYRISSIDHL